MILGSYRKRLTEIFTRHELAIKQQGIKNEPIDEVSPFEPLDNVPRQRYDLVIKVTDDDIHAFVHGVTEEEADTLQRILKSKLVKASEGMLRVEKVFTKHAWTRVG